jgi:hypothetical protein
MWSSSPCLRWEPSEFLSLSFSTSTANNRRPGLPPFILSSRSIVLIVPSPYLFEQMVEERTLLADPEGETRGSEGETKQDVEGMEPGSEGLLWSRLDDQETVGRRHFCVHRRVSRGRFPRLGSDDRSLMDPYLLLFCGN